jgi:hypothetical protein
MFGNDEAAVVTDRRGVAKSSPDKRLSPLGIGLPSRPPTPLQSRPRRARNPVGPDKICKEAEMSSLNVYGWIRDSVRRAVLLGFSDAVEQVGALDGNQNLNPQLLACLKANPGAIGATTATLEPEAEPETAKPRRRLGRTLNDIQQERDK